MSSSSHVSQSHNALHAPHYRGAVNRDTRVYQVGGQLRYADPEQAVVNGYRREVWHELNFTPNPGTDFFQGTGNIYCELPMDYDQIDRIDLRIDFKNGDASDCSFNSLPSNLIDKIEIQQGDRTVETVRNVPMWMDQVLYRDKWELERFQDTTRIDPSSLAIGFDIAAGATANSPPCVIPIRSVISSGVPTAALSEPIRIKVYSAGRTGTDVVNCTDFLQTDMKLWVREKRRLDSQIADLVRQPLDFRYVQPKLEERSIALTSGSTTRTTLQNFNESDLASHVFVLIRSSTLTGTARDQFQEVCTNIWLEDEQGQNLTGGIQWSGTDLLNIVLPDKLTNDVQRVHPAYLVFCPSEDPVSDYKRGTQFGIQPLSRNMKLCITSNATGTYDVTVVVMEPRHARAEMGQLSIY